MIQSHCEINFLDITIYKNSRNTLQARIFQKSLNKYLYISPSSCYLKKVLRGFIIGELTRYARLSSNIYDYISIKYEFKSRLLQRGYNHSFLDPIFLKHHWASRYHKKTSDLSNLTPFIIPFIRRFLNCSLEHVFIRYKHRFIPYAKI